MKFFIALFFLAGILLATGCTGAESQRLANNVGSRARVIINNGRERTFKNTEHPSTAEHTCEHIAIPGEHICDQLRAERLTEVVNSLNGIDSATVVVSGTKAVVALELCGSLDYEQLLDFKKLVEHNVKRADEGITRVSVTTCAGLTPLMPLL